MKNSQSLIPRFDDVAAASERIAGVAARTPILTSRTLDHIGGARFFLKCENFQRTGSFKFRGAYNALVRLSGEQRKAGVVTFSTGNHGQAVALAARILDSSATLILPLDAPPSKLTAAKGYGADIIALDRYTQDLEQYARATANHLGCELIPPADHPDVIAGQATVVKEMFEECGELDALYVCVGGGSLLAGALIVAKSMSPSCRVYGVEPELGNDGQLSVRTGRLIRIDTPSTIADGAQTRQLGSMAFHIICRNVTDMLTVSDVELVQAMRILAERMKIVVEPTGCMGFAAAWRETSQLKGLRVGVIVSGGNIEIERFASLVSKY